MTAHACRQTSRSGLTLFGEFFEAMGLERLAERYMPRPRSGRGFEAIRYINPLCMSMCVSKIPRGKKSF